MTGLPPGGSEAGPGGPERLLWSVRPAHRSLAPTGLLALIGIVIGLLYQETITAGLVMSTFGLFPWTQGGYEILGGVVRAACLSPSLLFGLRLIRIRLTLYELTDRRLLIHHGLLVRRHDEVALHRIRDYVVKRPLIGMVLGFGTVRLVTRDPSLATVRLRDVALARTRSEEIRSAAYIWKQKIGYREFDTGSLN